MSDVFQTIAASFTRPNDAAPYAPGDMFGPLLVFPIVQARDLRIARVTVQSPNPTTLGDCDLIFFSTKPTVAADNATFTAAGGNWVGSMKMLGASLSGLTALASVGDTIGGRQPMSFRSEDVNLYAAIRLGVLGFTPVPNDVVTVRVTLELSNR